MNVRRFQPSVSTCALCILLCRSFCLLTCSGVNEDALIGPQVAKVKQHHEGGDVVHGEGGRLLEAHALWDEEGVVGRHHRHLLPQPKAAQHHHLIADLEHKAQDETGNNARNFSGFLPLSAIYLQGQKEY